MSCCYWENKNSLRRLVRRVDGPEQQNIWVQIPWRLGVGRHTDVHPFLKSRQSLDTTSLPWFNYLRHLPLNLDLRWDSQERTLLSGPWMAFPLDCKHPPCIRYWKKKSRNRIKSTHLLVLFSIKHICPFSVRRLEYHWFCAPGDKPQVSACSERFHNINNFFFKSLICFTFWGLFDTAGWGMQA